MSPGAPTRREAAGLRLDGQHTGKIWVPAARLDVTGPALEDIQGGKEEVKMDMAALTSGRRCRRGRPGEGGHVGGVVSTAAASSQLLSLAHRRPPVPRHGVAAASLLFFSPVAHTEETESKTPMGLVAWAAGIRSPLAFEARWRAARGESPGLPPGHARSSPCLRGARRGANG
jgi:hypothetical protein